MADLHDWRSQLTLHLLQITRGNTSCVWIRLMTPIISILMKPVIDPCIKTCVLHSFIQFFFFYLLSICIHPLHVCFLAAVSFLLLSLTLPDDSYLGSVCCLQRHRLMDAKLVHDLVCCGFFFSSSSSAEIRVRLQCPGSNYNSSTAPLPLWLSQ